MKSRLETDRVREKRNALQIVAQLPENRDEALRVLAYARELIDWEVPAAAGDGKVTALHR